MYQIGIDIGGTNVKIGLLNEALELCAEISIPFPHTTAEDMAAQIRAAVGPMLQARGAALSDVESLGAVVPGSIDAAGETVVDAHNLNFHNVPLRKILSDAFPGIPVYIANDANGAALAELYTGAFVGCKTGVLLTLGTGLGGGIILNGKVLMGAHAAAGEVSGLVSDISKMADDDFKLTSVERYSEAPLWAGMASASGLIFEYARRQKHLPMGSPMPTGEEIFAAYNAGEPEAQKALKIFARRVAVGILSLQNVLDVERVAIGGGISAAEALLPAIQAELDWLFERCTVMPTVKPELVRCRYGNDANLIGALKLFFEQNPA